MYSIKCLISFLDIANIYVTICLPRPRGARLKMVVIVLLDLLRKLNIYAMIKALIPNNSRSNIMDTEKNRK